MIMGVMHYIDRIVTQIVKPKVSVFMAIDGVGAYLLSMQGSWKYVIPFCFSNRTRAVLTQ